MAKQNIYDNEIFFAGYKKIRDKKVNANNLFEIPALFSMMPELKGKGNCYLYEKMGYCQTGKTRKINDNLTLVFYKKD